MPSEISGEVMEEATLYLEDKYRAEIIRKAQKNYLVTYQKLLDDAKNEE